MIAAIAILYYELCSRHIICCITISMRRVMATACFVQVAADINNCRLKTVLIFLPRLQAKALIQW